MDVHSTQWDIQGAVDKTLHLLTVLGAAGAPLDLGALTELAQLPRTTCHRLLGTLLKWGLVERAPNRRYVLGARTLELAGQYLADSSGRQNMRSLLLEARDISEESACLIIRRGGSRICVDFATSPHPIAYTPKLGETLPISVGASGRAFLSSIEGEEERRTALASLYEHLDADSFDAMVRRAEQERVQGYYISALDRPGMNGVAFPVKDIDRMIIGTVSVVGPSYRWTLDRIHADAPRIISAIERFQGTPYRFEDHQQKEA